MADLINKTDEMAEGQHTLPPPSAVSGPAQGFAEAETDAALETLIPHQPVEEPEAKTAKGKKQHSFGEKVFNASTYWGVGWFVNQALSLYITFNAMPKPTVQAGIRKLENAVKPLVSGYYRLTSNPGNLATRLKYVPDKARSVAEICCMFAAGCLVLIPMKVLENNKEPIVNWLNGKRHGVVPNGNGNGDTAPDDSKAGAKELANGKSPSSGSQAEDGKDESAEMVPANGKYIQPAHEKQTWPNLLRARVIAMASVLGLDQVIESYNNGRALKGKGNFDTMEWKAGEKLYEALPTRAREGFLSFFSRKGIKVESIQPLMQERLKKTVGHDVKKMIFAEQTRYFLKEFILCGILASIIFAASEAGLKRKKEEKKDEVKHPGETVPSGDAERQTASASANGGTTPSPASEDDREHARATDHIAARSLASRVTANGKFTDYAHQPATGQAMTL